MFNYTKFIYAGPKKKPSQVPNQTVSGNISTLQNTAQQTVDKRTKNAEKFKKNKNELFDYWMNNGSRFDAKEDNFLYETLTLNNRTIAREAFVLLSLIKKYWGKAKAMEVYKAAWVVDTFELKRVRLFFSVAKSSGLPFKPEGERAKMEIGVYWKGDAWYVWNNKTKSKDLHVGTFLHLNWNKAKAGLTAHDKDAKMEYLVDANRRSEVSSLIENETKNLQTPESEMNKKVLSWAKSKALNQWKTIPENLHGYMRRMYGERTGYYVYRYDSEKKRIYALRIKGANLQSTDGTAAYIDIKNGKLGTWHGYRNGDKFLKSDLLDNMSLVAVQKELVDFKSKEKPGSLTKEQKLSRTKGMVAKLSGLPRSFSYAYLEKDYLKVVEKKLVKKLTPALGASQAKEFASLRIKKLKDAINKYINEKTDTLKKAANDKPKTKFEVIVDSEEKVEVKFASRVDKLKYSGLAKKTKEAAKGADLKKLIDQKTDELKKAMGPLGMLLKFFKIDLRSDVAKYYKTGNKSLALWLAGGLGATVELGRRVLRGLGITSKKDLEKFLKKNGGVLEKDQPIKKKLKLQGYKITIPKGKGIKPSETFTANGETVSPQVKEKKKSKFSFLSFLSSKKSSNKFVMEDREIIIAKNDTIPKGTIIPKGAKIEKA